MVQRTGNRCCYERLDNKRVDEIKEDTSKELAGIIGGGEKKEAA